MERTTRRNLMALTGAGMTLGACGHFGFGDGGRDEITTKGYSPDYGLPASFDPETDASDNNFKTKFKPRYIALVHVILAEDWTLDVNYACYDFKTEADVDQRLRKAAEIFSEKIEDLGRIKRFKEMTSSFPDLYKFTKIKPGYDRDDLENFTFRSQTEIFFFFQKRGIEFNDDPLITFTSKMRDGGDCKENYSFFGATLVDTSALTGNLATEGRLIRLRNYVTNKDGKMIGSINDPKTYDYSMNILFRVKNKTPGAHELALIFDPDTGNGTGYEP